MYWGRSNDRTILWGCQGLSPTLLGRLRAQQDRSSLPSSTYSILALLLPPVGGLVSDVAPGGSVSTPQYSVLSAATRRTQASHVVSRQARQYPTTAMGVVGSIQAVLNLGGTWGHTVKLGGCDLFRPHPGDAHVHLA